MDQTSSRDGDFAIDLESGRGAINEVGTSNYVSGANVDVAMLCSGFMSDDGSTDGEHRINLSGNISDSSEVPQQNVRLSVDKKLEGEEAANVGEKKTGNENRKKTSAKKPSKPPRPPRGPSLDAADQKLIKEIAELAMIKRARIERLKALKKMKASKASSSSGNLFAMIFTILFCMVIIFQGLCSQKSSTASFEGSPEVSQSTEQAFISFHTHWNPSANDIVLPSSISPNLVESVSDPNPENKVSIASG